MYGSFTGALRDHAFDELRAAAVDALSRPGAPNQYQGLLDAVAYVLSEREPPTPQSRNVLHMGGYPSGPRLSDRDRNLMLEVFWDLFRCGTIILGLNDSNREFPWFTVSRYGSGEKIRRADG